MQTAQMNSPRFSYQATAPIVPTTPRTIDDFRPVHGSYAGSFSGKTRQPIWIAVGLIVVVAGIAAGVNMYSVGHTAKIEPVAPRESAFVQPSTSAVAAEASAPASPVAKGIVTGEALAPAIKASEAAVPAKARASVAAKPTPAIPKKVAAEPAQLVAPPEVVPAIPPIVEPTPVPLPIVIEKPIAPVPAPVPDAAPAEPKP